MSLHIKKTEVYLTNLQSRLPFRYGIAVMTGVPHCVVRVHLEDAGAVSAGIAADSFMPKWFTKDPATTFRHDLGEILRVLDHAREAAEAAGSHDTIFGLWRAAYDSHKKWAERENIPSLLANFGMSLVERGVIDAFLRSRRMTLSQAINENAFGIDLGYFHDSLAGTAPGQFLPKAPLEEVYLRHTLGLSDPLTEEDRTDDPRVDDGLPVSFEACIQTYGLRYFKLKIQGKVETDFERLRHAASVIRKNAPSDYVFTLDGNEQYKSFSDLQRLFELMKNDAEMSEFLQHLLFVEQPLYRATALSDEAGAGLQAWKNHPPVIIDESDGNTEDFERALALDYCGTSHKNCKGIFKGIAHGCLVKHLQRQNPGRLYFQSGEDLTNIGPIAVAQDLSVMAHLGIDHVERNGHHYFTGLSFLPQDLQQSVLQAHPDLFCRHSRGYVTLRVEQGKIRLGSLFQNSLGLENDLGLSWLTPRADWHFDPSWD